MTQIPLQVTFRHMSTSEALVEHIRGEADKLERFFDGITRVRVVVEMPHVHHRHGRHFRILVTLSVPGEEIVIGRDPAEHFLHEDPVLTVNEVFRVAQRKLSEYTRRKHGVTKRHQPPPEGVVIRVNRDAGFGFLQSTDGREIYFHRNAVKNGGFERLAVGASVAFSEEPGEHGPQASAVTPLHPPRWIQA